MAMKIMIHGAWRWPQYEEGFACGLRENGALVLESRIVSAPGFLGSLSEALPIAGPAAVADGRRLVARAESERPEAILFWRPTHILTSTIRSLRAMGITTISFNNDDPFSPQAARNPKWRVREMWRLYRKALPEFDFNFFFRDVNCQEALAEGAKQARTMLPYFLPWRDRPVGLDAVDEARFGADVAFVGHYENDGRDADIRALTERGIRVRVWGDSSWRYSKTIQDIPIPKPIRPALGSDYAKALAGAKICLCYMSKLNRDGYTRRCFEIPAVGSVMLAERTPELMQLFCEDKEACFFSSRGELLAKAEKLLADGRLRAHIAAGGRQRIWVDGHDVVSRARQFLETLSTLRADTRDAAEKKSAA
ncbi:glycosyltransferase [Methylosinus sp. PW1]|uniref:CgeB family protein n=1 Tax=Methylosinus sp. PW1 TaxID=107636 RepID=UPI000689A3EA|nr:glycosyltransferase [Methylosinus sp. PW1]